MKMLIPVGNGTFATQEIVQVYAIIRHNGLRMALHRPHKDHPSKNELWIVSDLESGLHICCGLSKSFVIKKSEILVEKHLNKIEEKKNIYFEKTVFI